MDELCQALEAAVLVDVGSFVEQRVGGVNDWLTAMWTLLGLLDWAARLTFVVIRARERQPNDSRESRTPYSMKATGYPVGWWQLGVTDPVNLLTAIESAMIADGHPAKGLSVAALDQRYAAGPATWPAARELESG